MSEFMLVIYAVFNCKTLKWINEHSTVNRNPCCSTLRYKLIVVQLIVRILSRNDWPACCRAAANFLSRLVTWKSSYNFHMKPHFCRCIYDHTYLQESDDPLLTCRPYRYQHSNSFSVQWYWKVVKNHH